MKECKHITELRKYLKENKILVWSERGEEPRGWVNVMCEQEGCTGPRFIEDCIRWNQEDKNEDD